VDRLNSIGFKYSVKNFHHEERQTHEIILKKFSPRRHEEHEEKQNHEIILKNFSLQRHEEHEEKQKHEIILKNFHHEDTKSTKKSKNMKSF